jgi:integrase
MKLSDACQLALTTRWKGIRKEPTYRGWCRDLCEFWPDKTLETLTEGNIRTLTALLESEGLAPPTIYARVSHIATLYEVARAHGYKGPEPTPMPYPRVPRKPKWWLKPQVHEEVVAWSQREGLHDLTDYVNWTVATGLRVEETLRCTRAHFLVDVADFTLWSLSVPGTKNVQSEATLPLGETAALIAHKRFIQVGCLGAATSREPLFSLTYLELWSQWTRCAETLGLGEGATPKALRRTYARDRSGKGVPLPVLQQMMRHKDPATTLEYLRLTGGEFTTEEMRRWA